MPLSLPLFDEEEKKHPVSKALALRLLQSGGGKETQQKASTLNIHPNLNSGREGDCSLSIIHSDRIPT